MNPHTRLINRCRVFARAIFLDLLLSWDCVLITLSKNNLNDSSDLLELTDGGEGLLKVHLIAL